MQPYFQVKAMLAITKASLRSIFRSPSAVIFSIAFPLIFILVFGFLSSGGNISVKVAMDPESDTANYIYSSFKKIPGLKIAPSDQQNIDAELAKGRITALIHIEATGNPTQPYLINLTSSEAANPQNIEVLKSILNSVISRVNDSSFKDRPSYAKVNNI
ncbi:MAG: ABC transporter permease, partial [Sediminibacterium sp.]